MRHLGFEEWQETCIDDAIENDSRVDFTDDDCCHALYEGCVCGEFPVRQMEEHQAREYFSKEMYRRTLIDDMCALERYLNKPEGEKLFSMELMPFQYRRGGSIHLSQPWSPT